MLDEIAAALGLKRVGWIFTDLIAEDVAKGTVSGGVVSVWEAWLGQRFSQMEAWLVIGDQLGCTIIEVR